jgi:hypothetical protein
MQRIKNYFESRQTLKTVKQANDYHTIKPFLHGSQLEYRRFGNYVFLKDSVGNQEALSKRNFVDFRESVQRHVNWELNDDVLDFGTSIMYNKKYNIMLVMIPEQSWNTLNTAVTIAEKTTASIDIQREILFNAYITLNS